MNCPKILFYPILGQITDYGLLIAYLLFSKNPVFATRPQGRSAFALKETLMRIVGIARHCKFSVLIVTFFPRPPSSMLMKNRSYG